MADTTAPEASVWIVGEMPDGAKILSNDGSGADESEVWNENSPEEKSTLAEMDVAAGEAVIGWYAEPEPYTDSTPEVIEDTPEVAEMAVPEDEDVAPVDPVDTDEEDDDVGEPDKAIAAAVSDEMLTEIEASLDGYESLVTELLMAQMEDERFADEEGATPEVDRPAPAAQHARVAAAARQFIENINSAVTAAAVMGTDDDDEDENEDEVSSEDVPADAPDKAKTKSEAELVEARRLKMKKDKDAEVAAIEDESDMADADVAPDGSPMFPEDGEDTEGADDADDADERLVTIRDRMGKLEEAITRLMNMGQEDAEIEEPDVSEEDSTVDERDMGSM